MGGTPAEAVGIHSHRLLTTDPTKAWERLQRWEGVRHPDPPRPGSGCWVLEGGGHGLSGSASLHAGAADRKGGQTCSLGISRNPWFWNHPVFARDLGRKRHRISGKRHRISGTPGITGETCQGKGSEASFGACFDSRDPGIRESWAWNQANNPDRFQRRRSGAFSSQGHPPQVPGIAGLSRMSGDISGVLLELSNSRLRVGPKLLNK